MSHFQPPYYILHYILLKYHSRSMTTSRRQQESKTRAGYRISVLKSSELNGTRSHDTEKFISILTNHMTVSLYTDLLFVLEMNLCPHNAMYL